MEQAPDDPRAQVPVHPGRNHLWKPPDDMTRPLSAFQEAFVLSIYPRGTHIVSARFHRTVRLPCPVWVRVALPDGEEQVVILRMDYTPGGVEREAIVLPSLAKHGLPVPTILAGPLLDPTQPEAGLMMLLNVLPGQDLLGWSWDRSAKEINHALSLVLEGVERLHLLTEPLKRDDLAGRLPQQTLYMELQEIVAGGGPWFTEATFVQAVERLTPVVAALQTPLAFSSGDYNQGNFLFEGDSLTGFIDFTGACFEDPHVGMAMYWIYSWYPLDRAGIVERYLEHHNLLFSDFAPRLAVRCLRTLQQQIAVIGGEDLRDEDDFESHAEYRCRVLGFLQRAMQAIG
ncbi:MAG TPA: aminoglycoside phosphotransferase family protein [Ktedonosporobacter sp.]|jgi:aminoglycoside phosphotransferase|nr:aminoglycoside phosphotransferase family protein [Ktedonosporobacter sp.]